MVRNSITIKDIYDIVNRLEDKFDNKFTDLDNRVGKLEGFMNRAIGILGLFTTIISLTITYVWNKLIGKN